MTPTTRHRLSAAWVALVVAIWIWDWNREFHDGTLAGVAAVHLHEVALACRSAAYSKPPRRATAPPATPSPACALFPEPVRASCR
jgi:hypothetical protein